MKNHIQRVIVLGLIFLLAACDLWIAGSSKTGYKIIIKTNELPFEAIEELDQILVGDGYQWTWKERLVDFPRYQGEIYSAFSKSFMVNSKNEVVDIYLQYVKDKESKSAKHIMITIQNWIRGGMLPEVKHEIDSSANLIHQYLQKRIEKDAISIQKFGKLS